MSPIEHAPTETNGSIAVPDTNGRFIVYTSTQALFFSLDTSRQDQCDAVEPIAFHRRHGRRRLWRQGRYHDRAALHFGGTADRRAGALSVQPPRGNAVRLAARRRAHLRQGRRHERRADRRPQSAGLFRQRRVYAAFELRGRSNAQPTFPGPTRSPTFTPMFSASSPTARRRPPCAGSASPRSTSRLNARWTRARPRSEWTRLNSASSTPTATAT